MKLITAIIKPDKIDAVREALAQEEIFRITVSRCAGRGRAEEIDIFRGKEVVPELLSKVRIDIACNDEFVEKAINTIMESAIHGDGEVGDGKIFVTNLEQCIRIRTKERGEAAI